MPKKAAALLSAFYVPSIKDESLVTSRETPCVPLGRTSVVWRAILGSTSLVFSWENPEDAPILREAQKLPNAFRRIYDGGF